MKEKLDIPKILMISNRNINTHPIKYGIKDTSNEKYPTNIMYKIGGNRDWGPSLSDYCYLFDVDYMSFNDRNFLNTIDDVAHQYDYIMFSFTGTTVPTYWERTVKAHGKKLIAIPEIAPMNYSFMGNGIKSPVEYNAYYKYLFAGTINYNITCDSWFNVTTGIPAAVLRYPINTNYWSSYFKSREKKNNSILSGSANLGIWQNSYASFMVALRASDGKHPIDIAVTSYMEEAKKYDYLWNTLQEDNKTKINFIYDLTCNENEHITAVANSMVAVHLYQDPSPHRFAFNCALTGTPLVCCKNTDAELLFPQTAVNGDDLVSAVLMTRRLIDNVDFYNEVADYAFKAIDVVSYKNSINKFHNIINIIKKWDYSL